MFLLKYVIKFIPLIALGCFVFFDEEPLFDITDLNIFLVATLVMGILSVIIDNTIKAAYGSFVARDGLLWCYSTTTFLGILCYVVLIWFVFFLHIIAPLVADSVDSIFVTPSFVHALEFFCIFIGFVFLLVRSLLMLINYVSYNLKVKILLVCFVVVVYLFVLASIELLLRFYSFATLINTTAICSNDACASSVLATSYSLLDPTRKDFIWYLTRPEIPVDFSLPYAQFLAVLVAWLHLSIVLVLVSSLLLVVVAYPDTSSKITSGWVSILDVFFVVLNLALFLIGLFIILRDLQVYFFIVLKWLNLPRSLFNDDLFRKYLNQMR